MAFITLRVPNSGRYVEAQPGPSPLSCAAARPALFELLQLSDGKAMLRLASTGRFVVVQDEWCLPMAGEPNAQCVLHLVRLDGDAIALQSPDGVHYLSAANGETIVANATEIGEHERFAMEVRQDADMTSLMMRGCCGTIRAGEGPKIAWEEGAHKRIVEKAVEMLAALPDLIAVKYFLDVYWKNATFKTYVFKGLKDADDKAPWASNNWRSHFYNPDTGKHYGNSDEVTALTEGRRYFGLSHHVGARVWRMQGPPGPGDTLYKHAGYYLGLSLHFLTDLTQPMHAANFTNAYGDEGNWTANLYDRRHAGFEIFGDDAILLHKLVDDLDPLKPTDLDPFTDVGSYLKEVAAAAKSVFSRDLKAILDTKASEKFHGIPEPLYRESFWRSSEATPALKKSLRLAPLRVARYLANWIRRVMMPLGLFSNQWYSILEPTKAPSDGNLDKYEVADLSSLGSVVRWKWEQKDNQKWFLHFNDDGTVSIGSRQGKNYVWLMWENINVMWVGRGPSAGDRMTRFRAIPHDDKNQRFWIFEPSKNEVVTVKPDTPYPGYFIRWDPYDPGKQLFRFRELGAITDSEKTEIKKNFPDFGKHEWWGSRGVVPVWELPLGN